MIAVDTNILVYAHREDSPWYEVAYTQLANLAEGASPWAICWPCIHEFLAIVTHPRIWRPPTPLAVACEAVRAWLESPSLILLSEAEGYWPILQRTIERAKISGPRVHDARIVALCLLHGVSEIWTADRDFHAFPEVTVRNPLVG
ncbi:MAG: PIN domain-containing protein [Bradymonadales bacterium]|nr:PIN domain-containing protein [Bradymonadales bacterium]